MRIVKDYNQYVMCNLDRVYSRKELNPSYVKGKMIESKYETEEAAGESQGASRKGGGEGLIRQPKYGHLKGLYKVVKKCEKALVSADPIMTSLGPLQQAHVYDAGSAHCAAFLSNYYTQSAAKVLNDYFS
ncbi:hypothetical protein OROMI_012448 [Orobanche minor]